MSIHLRIYMPFVTAAKEFLEDPGELANDKNLDLMNDTVNYFLTHAVGLKCAKSTDTIIKFLNELGYEINRHGWETDVLGKLREEGIFIASHRSKGMYLINSREEAENFYSQYLKRIAKQKYRLDLLRDLIDNYQWNSALGTKGEFDVEPSGGTVHVPITPSHKKQKK